MSRTLSAILFMLFLGTVYQPSLNINLPAPHPAEAFETVISVGIGSLGDALIIDADGVVWNQMVESYECNEPQWYAPQADAVWNPYWVRFLLDEDGVLWAYGGGMDAPSGAASDMDSEYPAGYVRDWTPVLENVVALDSNNDTTAALQADGTLWAWGQLHGAMSYTPVRVTDGVRSFSYAGYAVKTDNTLYAWSGRA